MKKNLIEFIGTFFLVLTIGLTNNPIAIGVILIAMVYMGGHISGAHYNPAVTVAMIIRKLISIKNAIYFIISQFLAATLAALIVKILTNNTMTVSPNLNHSSLEILLVEVLFTFALVLVILNVATNSKTKGNSYYGIAIGLTVMAGAFAGGEISGGAYNPAVGLGPCIIELFLNETTNISSLWFYFVGPILGSILATFVYEFSSKN